MRKGGLFALLLLLAAVFTVKRCFPEQVEKIKGELNEFIAGDMEYIEAIEAMGSKLIHSFSGEGARQVLNEDITASANEFLENARERWKQALQQPPQEKELAVEERSGELPDAVSAFVAEQLSFSGQSIPENVRMDMPELPFEYSYPVEGTGSSGFGFREHPIEEQIKFHYGTDFAADDGTAVSAFASGSVKCTGKDESYGNYVIISHEGEAETLYAHLSRICVAEGEQVDMGQLIGQVGATGLATGPHLHFELKLGQFYLNPEFYL